MLGNPYKCSCGGSLVPVKIAVDYKGQIFTVCYKQWCAKCGNSRIDDEGKTIYYIIRTDYGFDFEPSNFWCLPDIPFQHKMKFINAVLKLAEEHRFEGKQVYTMEQIRNAYRADQTKNNYNTYGEDKI